jgi:2,4-dienoyl-CoA reductase (NADPH2)
VAEKVLADGDADMVSMARPLLADAEFVNKAASGRADEINVCIACNQACLDHAFNRKTASCLLNPRACRETELNYRPTASPKSLAVVGAGPAGLAFSCVAAERGHRVTLFDSADRIGGQFNMAKRIPGKEEFYETLKYYGRQLELKGVDLKLGVRADADLLRTYDEVVLATGISPRTPDIEGIGHESVLGYVDVLRDGAEVGRKVAIIGAGGIGFDVAEFLGDEAVDGPEFPAPEAFMRQWGIDMSLEARGGVRDVKAQPEPLAREIWLLQRKTSKPGSGLGKTTGWVHRLSLRERGQEPLEAAGIKLHLIGGADVAVELDAKRAIRQGSELAAEI